MKPQDLNTYINNKLDEGSGLRYREEYWNDMNSLLDANMPLVTPENVPANAKTQSTTATQTSAAAKTTLLTQTATAIKTAVTGLKLSALLSACAATAGGTLIYFQLFNTPASVPAENKKETRNSTPTKSQTTTPAPLSVPESDIPTTEETTVSTEASAPRNIINGNNGGSLPPDQTTNIVTSMNPEPAQNSPVPVTAAQTPEKPIMDNMSTDIPSSEIVATNDQIKTYSSNLIMIEPLTLSKQTTELNPAGTTSNVTPPHLKRNRLIKHLDVSPFAGMIAETGNQRYQSGNTEYVHPAQSNFTYGINIECATKHFSVRTGIGLSRTTLQSSVTTADDIYDVDTNYIIVNPNYGTTPSGKPIALIRRQIDSSYVSTAYTTTKSRTTYQYITIPLTLQYKIAYKRFTTMIEGGGLHQIMISQESNASYSAESENRMVFPTYHFQLTAGGSIRYAITSQWAVGVQYNYNLNPSGANLHFLNNAHTGILMITRSIY